jgi:hypothetical protein
MTAPDATAVDEDGCVPHRYVYATVTAPWGEVSRHYVGSLPTWVEEDGGIPADWKAVRRANVLLDLGHTPRRGDGWRVRFASQSTPDADDYGEVPA